MLGQFYDAETDRYFGSIYRNEMEYHMFTRTIDGFCDKCDLNPPERTDEEGFKLPGHRFHSKAKEFQDVYFKDWQSNKLFTDMSATIDVQSKLFKFDQEGQFLIEILSQQELLRLTAGTFGETNDFQNFVTCEEPDFGIKIDTGYWIATKLDEYPTDFKISMEHFQSSSLPTHIVTKVWYGCKALVRFACETYNREECVSNLRVFLQCQELHVLPSVLKNLPSYKTWIGPACYKANFPVLGPHVMPLGVTYNEVDGYIAAALRQNNGKGIVLFSEMDELGRYPDCKYNIGTKNELLLEAKSKLTIDYNYNTYCELNISVLAVLYKSILDALNVVADYNNDKAALFLNKFQERLAEFRSDLTYILFAKDNKIRPRCYRPGVDFAIQNYWSSEWSPGKIITKLYDIIKREEEEETDSNLLCQLIAKGVKFFPKNRLVSEERVILEFPRLELSRNHIFWETTIAFFNNLVEDQIEGRKRFYYINEIKHQTTSNVGLTKNWVIVKHCLDRNVISFDMFREFHSRNRILKPQCTISGTAIPWVFRMPSELLALICPSSWLNQCSQVYRNWSCERCKCFIRYDSVTSSAVCFCGKIFLQDSVLKCWHQNYRRIPYYPNITFISQGPKSQINILVLGEEGCGKSTFIYSLYRHLSHKTTRTSHHENQDVVPKSIFRKRGIKKCRSYVIPIGETKFLKIIDTPGFPSGLIDGVPFVASVLNHASQSSLIHALCIVVKSDVAGFSIGFRSMFNSLLKVLLPNKLQNVFFLVTHLDCSGVGFEERSLLSISDVELNSDILNGERTFILNNIDFVNLMNSTKTPKRKDRKIDMEENHGLWEHGIKEYERLISDVSKMEPFDPTVNLRFEEKYITKMEEIVVLP